ncbi:MAG: hypothetical protein KKC84_00750, partial [Candidatus Omnitrophica bacterium]|nr:hypothetical protein [Candidatus Omnitrophota bacterium]
MKLLHATFLGQSKHSRPKGSIHEVPWTMWLPCIVLGALCIVFGIFAIQIPLRYFIFPVMADAATLERGVAGASVLFIFIGLLTGLFLVKAKSARRLVREDASCGVGGEEAAHLEEKRVTGSDFYATIKELGFLRRVYRAAEAGSFDIYEQGKSVVFGLGKFLQYLHNGILPTYLVWTLLGMIGLFFILFR